MGNSRSALTKSGDLTEPVHLDQNNCAVNSDNGDDLFSEQFEKFQQKSFSTVCCPETVAKATDKPIKAFTEPVRRLKPFRSLALGTHNAKSVSFKSNYVEKKPNRAAKAVSERVVSESPLSKEEPASRAGDEERCVHLSVESSEKIENINNLIEALANFNKIFKQFPRDYDKLVKKILNFIYVHSTKNPNEFKKIGHNLSKISEENLTAIQSLISHLSDHSKAVQNMMLLMSRLEERIETTNQVLRSNSQSDVVEPFLQHDLVKVERRSFKIRKSSQK